MLVLVVMVTGTSVPPVLLLVRRWSEQYAVITKAFGGLAAQPRTRAPPSGSPPRRGPASRGRPPAARWRAWRLCRAPRAGLPPPAARPSLPGIGPPARRTHRDACLYLPLGNTPHVHSAARQGKKWDT